MWGYLDDEMRRRSREIAIRKVNGASAADIFALLTRDAAVLTLPSVAAGTLAGYLVLARVLELFVERIAPALVGSSPAWRPPLPPWSSSSC